MASIKSIFCLLTLTSAVTQCDKAAHDDSLVVPTSKGSVKGATLKALDKKVDAFLGIPYAKPPLGELRFQFPQPADPWSEVADATKPPNTCIQANFTWFEEVGTRKTIQPNTLLSEDCLTLNVWVPRPRPKSVAVMVWIHGGGFLGGSPNFPAYDPRILCAEEQIIVVAISYRLGAFGFLYLNRPDVPGNAGLFDQHMALQWVRDNIHNFGGDPDRVTLFGHSAGAASVTAHLLSPLSRDLFTRGIAMSGSVNTPLWPMDKTASVKDGLTLAERLQCPHDAMNMDAVVACLRAKDPIEIIHTESDMYKFLNYPFIPVFDGNFFPEQVGDAISSMHFKKTDIILGVTSGDGNIFIPPFLPDYFDLKKDVQLSRQQFVDSVKRLTPSLEKLVYAALFYEYTDWNDRENSTANRDAVGEFVGDYYFKCPAGEFARKYAEAGSDVYTYVFTHILSVKWYPEWMGSLHGYEIPFWFGQALSPERGFTEEEKKFARRIMRYWANFARTGNPNEGPNGSVEPILWPLFTINDQKYLTLSAKSKEVGKDYRARRCAFWQEYIPKLKRHASKPTEKCTTPDKDKQDGLSTSTLLQVMVGVFAIFTIYLKLW